jgi:hypothetical protein
MSHQQSGKTVPLPASPGGKAPPFTVQRAGPAGCWFGRLVTG